MNSNFSRWVTSAAFNIQLSVPQIKVIKELAEAGGVDSDALHPMVLHSMQRRGLIETAGDYIALSRAGALLAELVVEAGISDDMLGLTTTTDRAIRGTARAHPAIALKAEGLSNEEIAERLNIKPDSVQKALRRGHADISA